MVTKRLNSQAVFEPCLLHVLNVMCTACVWDKLKQVRPQILESMHFFASTQPFYSISIKQSLFLHRTNNPGRLQMLAWHRTSVNISGRAANGMSWIEEKLTLGSCV